MQKILAMTSKIDDVFQRCDLTQQQLDVPVSYKHCREFSEKLAEWEPLAPRLYLTDTDIATIKHDHPLNLRSQCSACLNKWQGKFGSQATFLKLAQALEGNVDRIEKLCEYFNTTSGSENEEGVRKVGVNGRETEITAEEKIRDAEEKIRDAEEKIRDAEEKIRDAEEKIRDAEEKIRHAEKKTKNAETRASKAEERAKNIEEQWLVERKQINIIEVELLHEGRWGQGDVQVAQFGYTRVAAKSSNLAHFKVQPVSSPPASNWWYSMFISEMNIIASLRHPNMVQFLGACVDHEAIVVLTELMHTSLRQQLMKKDIHFTKKQVITISLDVAKALNYLHHRDIVHQNLMTDHILLEPLADQQWKAKVIGSSLRNLQKRLEDVHTCMYASPSMPPTPKRNIYSFGVVLVEMCMDVYDFEVEIYGYDEVQTAANSIEDQTLSELIKNCTQKARQNRPSAKNIIIKLEQQNLHKD